jgi:hypothetical protein
MANDTSGSFSGAAAVTPSDSTILPTTAALYVGVSGDVAVVMDDSGTAVTFKAHPVGYLRAQVVKVLSTGTTATDILALY